MISTYNFIALAASKDTNTRAIFVLAAQKPPFNVYGNPFYDHAGWGNNFSVNQEGTLEKCVQNFEYMPKTGIHGMVFDASETYLYSADLRGNKVWTHKKDENGHLTLVGCVEAPDPLDHPRWVALHQNYLYVLMEAGNRLAVYVIDEQTHCPTFTHITYPLIPPGKSERFREYEHPTDTRQEFQTPRPCTAPMWSSCLTANNTSSPPLAPTPGI
jgi:carboxy-cis,cis-muconate cyclase